MSVYHIPDYYFEKFCEIETYDIRQYITNQNNKYELDEKQATSFPFYWNKTKKERGLQIVGWGFILTGIIGMIFFIAGMVYSKTSPSHNDINVPVAWFGFAMMAISWLVLFPLFYFWQKHKYIETSKHLLSNLRKTFQNMQTKGYIKKELSSYPQTLQMAFSSRIQWRKNQDHSIRYCCWYGYLSLLKFFYDYNQQNFPINNQIPFKNWFIKYINSNEY